jgi:hypothetical protein
VLRSKITKDVVPRASGFSHRGSFVLETDSIMVTEPCELQRFFEKGDVQVEGRRDLSDASMPCSLSHVRVSTPPKQ